MNRKDVVTPGHARWGQLIAKINEAVICDKTTRHTRAALAAMVDVDVEQTLLALAALGGRCDCEIVHGLAGRRSAQLA